MDVRRRMDWRGTGKRFEGHFCSVLAFFFEILQNRPAWAKNFT